MNTPADQSLKPLMDNNVAKTREKVSLRQVLTLKASSMQRIIQMMQKHCITALRFMCLPIQCPQCDRFIRYSAESKQPIKDKTEKEPLRDPHSTVLIVNISNSTLKNCIIGDNCQSTAADQQPLTQQPERFVQSQHTCRCSYGLQGAEQVRDPCPRLPLLSDAEQLSINIQSSRLTYVMVGDNSSMHVEQVQPCE